MTAAKLVRPAENYKESFLEALREFHQEGRYKHLDVEELRTNFKSFVEMMRTERGKPHHPFQEWVEPVPETVLWFVKDNQYLGTVDIRHRLNWHLERWGGHLHFILRPSMRNKGFGSKMIYKTIPFANYLGIEKALITIDPENQTLIEVIESCGGQFEDELAATKQFPARRRYWLDCT